MRRKDYYISDYEKKKGITIETNFQQVVAIIVIFLAMFVLPVQLSSLYEKSKPTQTGAYTEGSVQGVSSSKNSIQGSDVLGVFDSIIPESLKSSESTQNIILYAGIAGAVIALGVIGVVAFKK